MIAVPLTFLLRGTIERIEIGDEHYRHHFLNYPWLLPKDWDVKKIKSITLGSYDGEDDGTLNVSCGWRKDIIAYWAEEDFRRILFYAIQKHLSEIESHIQIVDHSAKTK